MNYKKQHSIPCYARNQDKYQRLMQARQKVMADNLKEIPSPNLGQFKKQNNNKNNCNQFKILNVYFIPMVLK